MLLRANFRSATVLPVHSSTLTSHHDKLDEKKESSLTLQNYQKSIVFGNVMRSNFMGDRTSSNVMPTFVQISALFFININKIFLRALGWHLVQEQCKSRTWRKGGKKLEERKRLKIVTWWAYQRAPELHLNIIYPGESLHKCVQLPKNEVIDNNKSEEWQEVNWKMAKVYAQLKNMDACENYQVKF